jgi:hypothetical protein
MCQITETASPVNGAPYREAGSRVFRPVRFTGVFPAGTFCPTSRLALYLRKVMPGKFAALRELPNDLRNVTTLAIAAMFVAITALVITLARHGS